MDGRNDDSDGSEVELLNPRSDTNETQEYTQEVIDNSEKWKERRNLIGFWLFGLCNNFAYVIMLSAAHDILNEESQSNNGTNSSIIEPTPAPANRSGKLIPECNRIGTGAILLADILPAVFIKITAPWYMQSIPYSVRVWLVTILAAASFLVVAIPKVVWINLIGVACASLSSGFGEITFLSLTSHYSKNTVSTWSSGTGAAGVFGALSYAGLTALGLSPRVTILIMLVIPVVLAISYFFILDQSDENHRSRDGLYTSKDDSSSDENRLLVNSSDSTSVAEMTFLRKLALIKPLLKYMIPLGLVYFAEYFINQALFELIYFENIWLPINQQYRWYQTIYQVGVLISRSSVNLVQIRRIWILTILQFLNVAVLMFQIFYQFLPSVWLVFAFILYEGLLGGGAYVNTFHRITVEIWRVDRREYSMGAASMADSLGIAFAGAVALPVHNFMCTLPK